MMRSLSSLWLAIVLLLGPAAVEAWADGGTLRLVERAGNYRISIFTSPTPLRAGPVDLSVLVQDAENGAPIEGVRVTVSLTSRTAPGSILRTKATAAAATNKLLRAALVDLPEPGLWNVEVACQGEGEPALVEFQMEAGPPLPRWLAVWPWFIWPAAAVLLFGVHRLLVARGTQRLRANLSHPLTASVEPRRLAGERDGD
jgi:hypothetical protein